MRWPPYSARRAGKPCPDFSSSASRVQYSTGLKASISASRSTIRRSAGVCTRPADSPGRIFFHNSGERLKPTRWSSARRACWALTRSPETSRGCSRASCTARLVISWNTMRCTGRPSSRPRSRSASQTCQLMASPSRSGSVARYNASAPRTARAMASMWRLLRSISWYFMAKPASGSTAPSFATRSRTWPYEASTLKSPPRYFSMVLALAGDSTMTRFLLISLRCCWSKKRAVARATTPVMARPGRRPQCATQARSSNTRSSMRA